MILKLRASLYASIFLLTCCACQAVAAPVASYRIVAKYPHATSSYTEGLFYRDGLFYEGTGMEGQSGLFAVQPETGQILQRQMLPAQYFGEGIVDWGANILQWTWQTHTGFIYDRFSFRKIGQFTYSGEGWGMTRTDREIITSDGSSVLKFRDPKTFHEVRQITVKDGANSIDQLNELEYVKGEILANVWHSDRIARISPRDGHVLGWIDLSGILDDSLKANPEAVLNGIAYDAKRDRLFVTGKLWPYVFEIKVVSNKR